jgi:hypothetical protein
MTDSISSMKRFPDGSVLYDDSPWFLEIGLLVFAVGLAAASWRLLSEAHPAYLMAGLLSIFVVICIAGMLVQQHRTFLFDPSIATMHWSARGLFRQSSGEVAFKDIIVGVDAFNGDRAVTYRVMLTTPAGSMPLYQAYVGDRRRVEQQAADLRVLLGQSSGSLHDDSVAQMAQSGNKIGAVAMLRDQSHMTLEDAVRTVDDQSK